MVCHHLQSDGADCHTILAGTLPGARLVPEFFEACEWHQFMAGKKMLTIDIVLACNADDSIPMEDTGIVAYSGSKGILPVTSTKYLSPSEQELLRQDISEGNSYVCLSDGRIVGTFYFISGKDIEPTYRTIYDGAWTDDSAYGVIHRIASDGTVRGIGQFCMEWAFGQCHHLRIDTHPDNKVMQNLLKKCGFVRCGTIYVTEDPYPRFAYEKVEPSHFPL